MYIEIFAVCEAANDSLGRLNLLGAFDTIGAVATPAVHPQLTVVARIRINQAEQGSHPLHVQIVDQDGAPIATAEGAFEVYAIDRDPSASTNLIITFHNLTFDRFGIYTVNLRIDDIPRSSIPLNIKPMPMPGVGATHD